MANGIIYRQGTKESYLGVQNKSQTTLYFCTDTKELFKGSDLYSDGVRFVNTLSNLPSLSVAAEGILYICNDTKSGYVVNAERTEWVQVVFGADNTSIEHNASGLLSVKSVQISKVAGLSDKLDEFSNAIKWVDFN